MLDIAAWTDELRERARVLVNGAPREGCVLYWMRVAVRDHENPALDAAIAAANEIGTTAFVYHAVSERYPFASDRHHTFVLEGARDVARGLSRRGIAYPFHVERPGARGPFLRLLAERAALVVTEDAPVPPLVEWTRRLGAHLAERRVPLVAVDASCVVPMPLLTQRYERAYAFRSASRRLASASLARSWSDVAPTRSPALPELPFEPVDAESLDDRAIARLVAACAIDHGVGPVRILRGGSTAGYARELHNNVRMTWGKAIPAWTRTPEEVRRTLVAMNHRHALDGRGPSSYGGLYWCLGLFDRPFTPEQPILGTVRTRPTSVHASRLDLDAYAARVSRPARAVGRVGSWAPASQPASRALARSRERDRDDSARLPRRSVHGARTRSAASCPAEGFRASQRRPCTRG